MTPAKRGRGHTRQENEDKTLNIKYAVENLNKPLLIAHGEKDLAVPLDEAHNLYNWSDKEQTEFFVVNSTGHTFDITHPFGESNEKFEKLLEKTNNFFKFNLIHKNK